MTLPKGIRKLFGVVLISVFLFLISPLPILASDDSSPNQGTSNNTQLPSGDPQIVPLPTPSGDEKITPLPLPNENYSIQQAGIFSSIGNALTAIGGDVFGFVGNVAEAAVGAALYIIEKAAVVQIGGEAIVSAVVMTSDGDYQGVQRLLEDLENNPNPARGGLIGVAGSTTGALLEMPMPISSGQYFASINPFKDAHAQLGGGEEGLTPEGSNNIILELWTRVRNVSYVLAVVVLIIVGFMIMLRIPLGPRTVVTVQNALPRIALALVLITFSYAISGLLIDLTRMASGVLNELVQVPWEGMAVRFIMIIVGGIFAGGIAFGVFGPAGLVVLLLLALILCVTVLAVLLFIIYKLLTRYVIFLLLTIFAPFFFLFGAIPGMEGAIFTWFKRSAAALIAIPVVGLILNLALAIGFGTPGDIPVVSLDLMGGDLQQAFSWIALSPIIGLGLFFFATKVPDIVDQIFDIKPAPRGGIGPMTIPAGVAGAAYGVGSATRALGGIRQAGTAYAGVPGWRGAIARQAVRFTGSTQDKIQAGLIKPGDQEYERHMTKEKQLREEKRSWGAAQQQQARQQQGQAPAIGKPRKQ